MLSTIKTAFVAILDLTYKPFSRFLPRQAWYYLACGGINTLNDWFLYFIIYNYIIKKSVVDLGFIAFSPHIAALIIVTPITFTLGFCFSKYITFSGSTVKTGHQLWRYASILALNFTVSYFSMKLFCDVLGLWATPSKMLTTGITTLLSFFMQKYFSFRKHKQEPEK